MTDAISASAKRLRRDLKAMEASNKQIETDISMNRSEDPNAQISLRLRQGQHNSLVKKFMKIMTDFNEIQTESKRRLKESMLKTLQVTCCRRAPWQLEAAIFFLFCWCLPPHGCSWSIRTSRPSRPTN